jgi:hypothetical protein
VFIDFPPGGRVLALDPATKTGFAFGAPSDAAPEIGTIDLGREHDGPGDVFGRALRWAEPRIKRVHLLVIEPPIPPGQLWHDSNYQSTAILHGLHAIFVGLAVARKVPVLEAPTRTWRKYFLGNGNLKRDAAKLAAKRLCRALKWGNPETLDDNAADAAGMWAWGCAMAAPAGVRRRIEPLFTQSTLFGRGASE